MGEKEGDISMALNTLLLMDNSTVYLTSDEKNILDIIGTIYTGDLSFTAALAIIDENFFQASNDEDKTEKPLEHSKLMFIFPRMGK